MNALDILDDIKNCIDRPLTDEDLREWAGLLKEAIYGSDDIKQAAGDTINTLMHECKQANFRAGNGYFEAHNKILLARYFNLLRFVIDGLDMKNKEEFFGCLRDEIYGTNEQGRQENRSTAKEPRQRTAREKKYFAKAIEAGLMQETETGYKWLYNGGSKASLAYFLQKVFNPDGTQTTPFKKLETLFNVSRLAAATYKLLCCKNMQKRKGGIDKLFEK